MAKELFKDSATKSLFVENGLGDFEKLWKLDVDWFEEPNSRRSGWSGVIKHTLKGPGAEPQYVFIKRQENHNCRTPLHPIHGIPTYRREYWNIRRLIQNGIPTLTTLFYGERKVNGFHQAILVTESLEAQISLHDYFTQPEDARDEATTEAVMRLAGATIRNMHEARFRHGSLYPKHVFVSVQSTSSPARLIDLEMLSRLPLKRMVRERDCIRFIKRCRMIPAPAMEVWIESYLRTSSDLSGTPLAEQLYSQLKKRKC